MPWHKEKNHSKCSAGQVAVVKDSDGSVAGCHASEEKADAQIRALYANEEDMMSETQQMNFIGPWGVLDFTPPQGIFTWNGVDTGSSMATITIDTAAPAEAEAEVEPVRWEAVLAVEGVATQDNTPTPRILMPDAVTWRALPLPLMAMVQDAGGNHAGHKLAGRIDEIWREPRPDIGENVWAIMGRGVFDSTGEDETGDYGRMIARLVSEKTLRGISIDPVEVEWSLVKADTLEVVDEVTLTIEEVLEGDYLAGMTSASIGAATVCTLQALEEATISILVASAATPHVETGYIWIDEEPLVACAAGPIDPPASWFEKPQLRQLTPVTTSAEGRVWGHVATRDCHMGAEDRCMKYTPLTDGGAHFHTGSIVTREGDTVRVGRMQVKPHAPRRMSFDEAVAYYSDPKTVGAFVRIYEDDFGLVVAGVTRSDAPAELLRDFYANPPSIEQRRGKLLGISCVPFPGLPVVSPEAYLVASGDGVEVEVLRLPPVTEETVAELAAEITEADVLVAAAALQGPEALAALIAE